MIGLVCDKNLHKKEIGLDPFQSILQDTKKYPLCNKLKERLVMYFQIFSGFLPNKGQTYLDIRLFPIVVLSLKCIFTHKPVAVLIFH